ncbi:MAG: hypothetical protein ACTSRK_21410 [Promethearchaeota archaeon]
MANIEQFNWENPSPLSNYSLTRIMKSVNKNQIQKLIPTRLFTSTQFELQNPYPKWVNELRLWAPIGTLTDYMVRKFLQIHFPERIQNQDITIAEKVNIMINQLESHIFQIPLYFQDRKEWVEIYNSSTDLQTLVRSASKMVNLDRLFREGLYIQDGRICLIESALKPEMDLSELQISQLCPFFEKISNYLSEKVAKVKNIYLNPVLGNEHYFKGDADLFLDKAIIEIKTVKNPNRYLYESYYQLLGYAAMQTWLQTYKEKHANIDISHYPSLDAHRIEYIGFLWPQQLQMSIMSIKKWTDFQRLKFLKGLIINTKKI